jgi:hypothetical protein
LHNDAASYILATSINSYLRGYFIMANIEVSVLSVEERNNAKKMLALVPAFRAAYDMGRTQVEAGNFFEVQQWNANITLTSIERCAAENIVEALMTDGVLEEGAFTGVKRNLNKPPLMDQHEQSGHSKTIEFLDPASRSFDVSYNTNRHYSTLVIRGSAIRESFLDEKLRTMDLNILVDNLSVSWAINISRR